MRPNIFRTIIFNLRAFGLRGAMKLPVYVYGRVKVYNMGRIELHAPMRRGMFRIGMNYTDTPLPYTIWDNQGTIDIYGPLWIHHGCRVHNMGRMIFRGGDIISHACVFDIYDELEFGQHVSVGYNSEFMDTDVHFCIDVASRKVKCNTKPIRIGNFNWLGSHTFVKKGTVTPDYLTVASPNAVLLKDYSKEWSPNCIVAGNPVHMVGMGKRRVYNYQNETMMRAVIRDKGEYVLPEDVDMDVFCKLKGFANSQFTIHNS